MGVVIAFRQHRRRRMAEQAEGPCEILLFTGVRYERHEDEATTAGRVDGRRRRARMSRRPRDKRRA